MYFETRLLSLSLPRKMSGKMPAIMPTKMLGRMPVRMLATVLVL